MIHTSGNLLAFHSIGKILCYLLLLVPTLAKAQGNLRSILDKVEFSYPAIRAAKASAEAIRLDIKLEENSTLPSLDIAYQSNYATVNNITGMAYPSRLLPISGPPSIDNNLSGVFGSAAGILFQWTPITFGQQEKKINYRQNLYNQRLTGIENEVLRLQYEATLYYLDLLNTFELIEVYEKNMERIRFNLLQASALVNQGIRPAIDSIKLEAVLSKAKSEYYDLQHLQHKLQFQLEELVSSRDAIQINRDTTLFRRLPRVPGQIDRISSPLLRSAQLRVSASEVQLDQVRSSWQPKIDFWSTIYARGSGITYSGERTPLNGWVFSRFNYGLGAQIAFPLMDGKNLQVRKQQQNALLDEARIHLEQTQLGVDRQMKVAQHYLNTALQIAEECPVEYRAATAGYLSLEARYRAGLVDYTELIQAQYDLLNAEMRWKTSHIVAWKALLEITVTQGSIQAFLNQIEN